MENDWSKDPPADRPLFAALAAVAVALLTAPRLLLHELWRDEAWLWLVATESNSLRELFAPLSRSGQGYLFPLLAWLARLLSTSPLALQGLHLLLATTAAWTFVRWAPFDRWTRVLFVFGYLPFYEYAVISRHYVLGALLVWLACAAARGRRVVLLGACLGLLCQTTVYGFLLAVAIGAGWLWARREGVRAGTPAPPRRREVLGLTLAASGAVAGLIQLAPAPGTSFAPGWQLDWDPALAARVLAMPWRALVPIPQSSLHFWNSNLLDLWPAALPFAGVAILLAAVALLWPQRVAGVTFAVGGLGLLAFGYVKYVGVVRHQGHWWLLLAAALWLGGAAGTTLAAGGWRRRLLLALLVCHVAVGALASVIDLRRPFSNGAATAALLRAEALDRLPLLGHREPPAATVALFLGRPLFAPSRGSFVTRPDWGPEQREMNDQELRCASRAFAHATARGDVVLVINRELPTWAEVEAVGARTGAIVASEDYHLYRLYHDRLAATFAAAACPQEAPAAASRQPATTGAAP